MVSGREDDCQVKLNGVKQLMAVLQEMMGDYILGVMSSQPLSMVTSTGSRCLQHQLDLTQKAHLLGELKTLLEMDGNGQGLLLMDMMDLR
jgi:hypothetical protein